MDKIDLERVTYFRLTQAGLIAASFATIFKLVDLNTTLPQQVSLYSFAIAIPLLALSIAATESVVLVSQHDARATWLIGQVETVGIATVVLGYVAFLWSFYPALGVVAGLTAIASAILWHWHLRRVAARS